MPIKDIQELNLPEYATLSDATFSAVDMGDRTISTQLQIDGDITPDFSFNWEVIYRGEKYIYKLREPQASKDTSSQKAKYDLLFRHWAIDKLTTEYYVKLHGEGVNAVVDQYVKPINYNLKDFCDEFNRVLTYYWGDAIQIDRNISWDYNVEPKLVSISYTKCWDLLQQIYQLFEVRWTFEAVEDGSDASNRHEKYVIKVGYPAPEIDKIFEYGKSANGEYGGLVKFDRQQQDNNIANKLLGRGGEKNLPLYYFKTAKKDSVWASDPDAIHETENLEYYGNLRGQTYRDYVRGFGVHRYGKTPPPASEQRWAYLQGYEDGAPNGVFRPIEFVKDDESIAKFGEITSGLDNNDDIFPTIQGIEVAPYGRIDECVDVEQIVSDNIEESVESNVVSSNLPSFTSASTEFYFGEIKSIQFKSTNFEVKEDIAPATLSYILNSSAVIRGISSTSFGTKKAQALIEKISESVELVNINDGKIYSTSNIPSGVYYIKVNVKIKSIETRGTSHYVTLSLDSLKLVSDNSIKSKWKQTFSIWVKNIWGSTKNAGETDKQYAERIWRPILGDRQGKEAAVMFSDGLLAHEDYEFTVMDFAYDASHELNGVKSEWRLTLAKSDAEVKTIDKMIPATIKQGSAGDKFFFIGIDMPYQYVLWAEDKLDQYKQDALLQTAQNNPTFLLDFDHVQWDKWTDQDYEEFIGDIHEGYRIRSTDKRFITDEAYKQLYVQSKEIKWENGKLLKRPSLVVTDKVMPVINPINQIQGQVDSLRSQLIGLSTTEQYIRLVGDRLYLRKDGVADRSISPTQFASLLTDVSFRQGVIGGKGWGFYKDDNGNSILELDKLVLRQDLEVNNLVANQVTVIGGKEVLSAVYATLTRVDDTADGYVCYFDQRQGTVANMFVVDDVAMCQSFSPDNLETKFYKRKVVSVSENTITLSKIIVNGDGLPEINDVIVQYGNYTNTSRQNVIIRDVIGGGYEQMLSGINSVSSNGDEYYLAGIQTGQGIRWFVGDANNNIEYKNKELNIRAKVTFTSGSSGLGNLDEWAGVEDNINNAQSTANEAKLASEAVNDYVQALESDVNAEIVAVNKRLDGVIENYFELYDPTLNNFPANEWTTDKLKEDHNGDTFTNTSTGNSWKWKIIGGAWKWDEITDTFEKELLKKISKAQETADGKIRNFVFQPYPPYSVGDTWSQGANGDLMRCIVSRTSGIFNASDWDKASKYTDDTAVDNLQIGGVNLALNSREGWHTTTQYNIIQGELSQNWEVGETYVITVKGSVNAGNSFGLWRDGGSVSAGFLTSVGGDLHRLVFVCPDRAGDTGSYSIYNFPSDTASEANISWVKIERGNKATDWSPAPEDVQADIDSAKNVAKAAETTANDAKTTGDAATAKLTDWASDSTISPTEKTSLKQQRTDIQSEYAEIIANAGKYAIATDNYTIAYAAAIEALAKYTSATPESIIIELDYANISTYYVARQTILEQIATATKAYTDSQTDYRREVIIDATALDQNTYYPVTMILTGKATMSNIEVFTDFNGDNGHPGWSTHSSKSFSCSCKWSALGQGWGAQDTDRVIDNYQYMFTVGYIPPIGSIDQMGNSSNEFIYVRGGGKYRFRYTFADDPVLHVGDFSVNGQTISPKTSVEKPSTVNNLAVGAQVAIAAMNDDGIFDVIEKQSIRTQWEAISGMPSTVNNPTIETGGSYIKTKNTAAKLSVATTTLTAAFDALKAYLDGIELYVSTNKEGFNRTEMSAKFTAYYDEEIAVTTKISKYQTISQGNVSKDDLFAKQLGYKSYADMVSSDGGFIEGEYLKNKVINTKQLIAENIKTALDGTRVEILGQDKKINIYDKNNVECITIGGNPATSFIPEGTEIINIPIMPVSLSGGGDDKTDNIGYLYITDEVSIPIASFTINKNISITIPKLSFTVKRNTTIIDGNVTYDLRCSIKSVLTITSADGYEKIIYNYENISKDINESIVIDPIRLDNMGLGSYYLHQYVYYEMRIVGNRVMTVNWNVNAGYMPDGPIILTKLTDPSTNLYNNGLTSYWTPNKYFGALNISNSDFVRAIDNNYGFKLNNTNGFLVTTNASSSIAKWNMPMDCALMGEVVGSTGAAIKMRSSSPLLKFESQKGRIAGEYLIAFVSDGGYQSNYFTKNTDYTVLIVPKSTTIAGYGLLEPNRTALEFVIHMQSYSHNTTDMDFAFFVIDVRNWNIYK